MEWLSRFQYEWEYIPGHHNMADPLSRLPNIGIGPVTLVAVTRARTSRVDPVAVGGEDVPLQTTRPDCGLRPPAAPRGRVLAPPAAGHPVQCEDGVLQQ
eukprot:244765-Chlamydomonas_euryale.AAC.1